MFKNLMAQADMRVICKACALFVLLTISGTSVGAPGQDEVVTISIEPKEAYIET